MTLMAHDVFISYVAGDRKAADAACAILEKNKIRCWTAPRDVLPGANWPKAIVDAIYESSLMVVILSSRSNGSKHVKCEVERAVHKGIPILPLRIEDVVPSSDLEYFLGTTHWLDALPPPLEVHLERLAKTVKSLLDLGEEDDGPRTEPVFSPGREKTPSIAVLPFVNMSPDADQEYFCDGMVEELINGLSRIEHLRVIARNSAFSYKGRSVNVRNIGRELNVDMVLEGSVRKAGNRLRVTAQLIDTVNDCHLWAESYDRMLGDVFAIQDDITANIVNMIKGRLWPEDGGRNTGDGFASTDGVVAGAVSPTQSRRPEDATGQPSRRRPANLEAYRLYLKGCYFRAKGMPGDLKIASGYFKQAIDIDPNYALPYAGIALSHALLPFYNPTLPREAVAQAKHLLQRALQLEPELPEAHGCLGFIRTWYEWDWAGAEQAIQHAVQLKPGSDRFHLWHAHYLMLRGRLEEALDAIKCAMELDPVAVVLHRDRGVIYYFARAYDQAIEASKETIEMDPCIMYAHFHLGAAYMEKGMYEEALVALQKEKEIARNCHTWAELLEGLTYAKMGQRDRTIQIRDALLDRSKQSYISPFHLACLHFELHEDDQGFRQLAAAKEAQDQWLCFLKTMPSYDRIASDVRLEPYAARI